MMGLSIVGLAIADRFLLKRKQTKILKIRRVNDCKSIRFILNYASDSAISDGVLTYSLRSMKRPNAIVSRTRKLDYAQRGINEEFLTFDMAQLEAEAGEPLSGEWVLDVKIQRSCSRINPLYKIFPISSTFKEVFEIAQQ